MTDLTAYILETFPELDLIGDADLRENVVQVYIDAMGQGGWERLDEIPFTLLIPDLDINYIEHVRTITRISVSAAEVLISNGVAINMDYLVAGALLHDVGKLLEYTVEGGKVVKSEHGKRLRHPVSGAALATKRDLPYEIVHIIAAHSKEGDHTMRTVESVIVHHSDFIHFESTKSERGMK